MSDRPRPGASPRIVIVGGGFAGLSCARGLGGAPAQVTLIDARNYHLFVPLLYQVATAVLSPADIVAPLRQILRRYPNVEVMLAHVTGADTAAREVRLGDGRAVPYDVLVLTTGSVHSYFGHPQWEQAAPALKTIEDAREIRGRVLMALEKAEMSRDSAQQATLMTTIVVGGGPTGVEMAGAVTELVHWTLRSEFRHIDPATASVVLIEAGPRLLPDFPAELSAYAQRVLEKKRVQVRLNCPVQDVWPDGVVLPDGFHRAGTIVWGAGVGPTPAGQWIGAPVDKRGRIAVGPDLAVRGMSGIYALGDVANCAGPDGLPLPGLAQVAVQQGRYLARALRERLAGRPPPPFRFHNRGNLATIGRSAAVADFGRVRLRGFIAWAIWSIVHIYLLIGFGNRALVAMQWFLVYVTNRRTARMITNKSRANGRAGDRHDRSDPAAGPPDTAGTD
jgi:NADH:ubiquinone reductase (H+-translocating)